ncbi:hypothetical protein IWX90DRAFT_486393 [Phyllosticta citrichinensis]|uniref:Uncharacterized protein n=1 Tax=Phyllosticta citrichinensis TaxID=1130410 RepID=A0ABR1XTB4_9PEZI
MMRSSQSNASPGLLVFFGLLVLLGSFCRPARAGVLAQLYGYCNTNCAPQISEQGLIQPNTKDSECYQFDNTVYSVYTQFQRDEDQCSFSVYTDENCSQNAQSVDTTEEESCSKNTRSSAPWHGSE